METLDGSRARPLVGVGFRPELSDWILARPSVVTCLEITAEHFFQGGIPFLRRLGEHFPLMVHGLGLSLGTPGPLDAETVSQFVAVAREASPLWVSDHVAFTRAAGTDFGHLNPVSPSRESLVVLTDHIQEISALCDRPFLVENITSHLRVPGEWGEPEFLGRLCEAAGCGLLLDVTNLFVNSRNHRFDPIAWLRELPAHAVRQLHVVGYSRLEEGWEDYHAEAIQDDLWELIGEAIRYARPEAVILERDDCFPALTELEAELTGLERMLAE